MDMPGMQDHDDMAIPNTPDRHACIMLGKKRLFLCHMTMFHMENHCYQYVIEAKLPPDVMMRYLEDRARHGNETYFLGNVDSDLFTVPQLIIGKRRSFIADIWCGIPCKKEYKEWPWNGVAPVFSSVPVTIERVVFFRHFDFNHDYPRTASYILFGADSEAFLTHYQVKEPDYDHVLTLKSNPTWLQDDQLCVGVPINFPEIPSTLQCKVPLKNREYRVQYAGFPRCGEVLEIEVARTEWFCTKIVNSSNPCPDHGSCQTGNGCE
jgi:hypothetical protein